MSYEPDPHAVQMKILRHLLLTKNATFAELRKNADMQSDQFTFHIKQLKKVNYITKIENAYQLTAAGKEYSNRMDTDNNVIEKQPKLAVILIIENSKNQILYQQRLKHPYYGHWGFATGKIRWGETICETAARELMEETGLTADLRIAGLYHKLDYDKSTNNLLEDKFFCIIHGTNPQGKLIIDSEGHHNEWGDENSTNNGKWFESISEIHKAIKKSEYVLIEKKYYYDSADY